MISIIRKIKQGKAGESGGGERVMVGLETEVREDLSEEGVFEQRPDELRE